MTSRACHLIALLVCLVAAPAAAQIVPPGSTAVQLITGFSFTEGPLYDGNGGVLFSDMNNADIVRYDVASDTAQIVDPASGTSNGLIKSPAGNVISADRDRRQISKRSIADIRVVESVLASNWMGTAFNGPNDLVMDANGGIYFTDPDYNNRRMMPEALYYINATGTLSQLKTFPTTGTNRRPNGVALSPGGSVLYLAVEMNKRIMAYDVAADGSISNERLFARTDVNAAGTILPGITNGPDGIAIDAAGNIYCAVQNAVFAWSPAGTRLFDLPVAQDPTNLKFGNADGRALFITAATSLYGIELNVPSPTLGDFDGDGHVTAADYTVWRNTLGSKENLSADADGSKEVDEADFAIWKTKFGNSLGSGATSDGLSVPEPSSIALLLYGLFSLLAARRRN